MVLPALAMPGLMELAVIAIVVAVCFVPVAAAALVIARRARGG